MQLTWRLLSIFFNAGIAIGAYLGGIITDSIGLIHTAWIGGVMVFVAVILTGWSRALESKDRKREGMKEGNSKKGEAC